MISLDLDKGDEILGGKFKNRKMIVKKIGKDDKNQPTINDKPMLKFRIPKLMEDTESLIKRYGLFSSSGLLLKFKNDPAEYMLKGLTPDRQGVFVSLKNQNQTYRKKISDLEKVNRKPIIENSSYLKEMPTTDSIVSKLGSTTRTAEKDFIPELSFAFRDAFSSFLDVMQHDSITKENPLFNTKFKELYPQYLQTALRALYYKYTVGKYNYLNALSYENFTNLVMPFMVTTEGNTFYDNLKNITLQAAKAVTDKLPKQESMNEDKALKIKVLLDKVLIEAKTAKVIKESEDSKVANAWNKLHPGEKAQFLSILFDREYSPSYKQFNELHPETQKLIIQQAEEGRFAIEENEDDSMDGEQAINEKAAVSIPQHLKVLEYMYFENGEHYGAGVFFEPVELHSKSKFAYLSPGDILTFDNEDESYHNEEGSDMPLETWKEHPDKFKVIGNVEESEELNEISYNSNLVITLQGRDFLKAIHDWTTDPDFDVNSEFSENSLEELFGAPTLVNLLIRGGVLKLGSKFGQQESEELTEYKSPLAPDSKDEMRIRDIMSKGIQAMRKKGVTNPQNISYAQRYLANQMADKITDPYKAYRRYKAAEDMNFHDIALVFYKKYRNLGGTR